MRSSRNLELVSIRRQRNKFQNLNGRINIDKSVYVQAPGRLSKRVNHNATIRPYAACRNVLWCSFLPDLIER